MYIYIERERERELNNVQHAAKENSEKKKPVLSGHSYTTSVCLSVCLSVWPLLMEPHFSVEEGGVTAVSVRDERETERENQAHSRE